VRAKVRVASQGGAGFTLLSVSDAGGGSIVRLFRTLQGRLAIADAPAGVKKTSTTVLRHGAWHDVELVVRVGSRPRIAVWLDGAPIRGLSTIRSTGRRLIDGYQIGDRRSGRSFTGYFDDVGVSPSSSLRRAESCLGVESRARLVCRLSHFAGVRALARGPVWPARPLATLGVGRRARPPGTPLLSTAEVAARSGLRKTRNRDKHDATAPTLGGSNKPRMDLCDRPRLQQ